MFSKRFRRLRLQSITREDTILRRPTVAEATAVAAASFLASYYVSGENNLLAAGIVLGGLAIASSLPSRVEEAFIAGLRINLKVPRSMVEGEKREGVMLVENRTPIPLVARIALEAEDGVGVEPNNVEVSMGPLSRSFVKIVVKPMFGRYKIAARIEDVRSPLGLWSLRPKRLHAAAEVIASPEPEDLREELGVLVKPGALGRGVQGSGLDYRSFREYQPGDDPRSIEWKLTSRRGLPVVRETEGAQSSKPVKLILAVQPQHYRKPIYNSPYAAVARRLYTISLKLAEEGVRHRVLLPDSHGFRELRITTPRDVLELGLALAIYSPESWVGDFAAAISALSREEGAPAIVVAPRGALEGLGALDGLYLVEV
ncbi:DUF58 domain-containing protein [Aeropyrum camini]|uniref:Uncharacterized conserved protein n=1 Tax=Aeropyrum camini SY1 = JCM 12091 TaxID=1198449 RepID=U3TDY6_9CREN|nr:DUF58 domain-containing protein [Aeropyrum camini]BAN89569.1 uncharacterized conserved protein [Aeropyrum camini SY1 = JCM 12091]